jgi:hypothetical protein
MNALSLGLPFGNGAPPEPAPPGAFTYYRPGGVDRYFRPNGVDTYLRN